MPERLLARRAAGVLFLWFATSTLLSAFQYADGAPPAPRVSPKYIFYWGSLQADLTAENHYHATATLTPRQFRQMLLRPPHLWTGAALAQQVSFRLDGHLITATKGEQDYVAKLGWLDEHIAPKATHGQTVRITDLYLAADATGSIDLLLEEPEPTEPTESVVWQNTTTSTLNTRLLEQVVWGREDIHELSNRDFFTADEFWQTIGQQPFAVWNPYVTPTPMRASIRLATRRQTDQGFSAMLEPDAYRGMVAEVGNYKHLVRPGTLVALSLFDDQHERLYEKALNIVADDDPRLALRRNRDAHTLRIKWGAVEHVMGNRYLLELRDAAGNPVPADAPQTLPFSVQHGELKHLLALRPQVWIDGLPVPDLAFSLTIGDRHERILPDQPMPDGLTDHFASTTAALRLHDLQAGGYDLSALTFSVRSFDPDVPLLLRNTLPVLLNAPGSARIRLEPPVAQGQVYEVFFELLEPAFVRLSVFEPDGWSPYNLEERYAAGKHRVEVPRAVFRRSGQHYLFLNTTFGVAKAEWDVR